MAQGKSQFWKDLNASVKKKYSQIKSDKLNKGRNILILIIIIHIIAIIFSRELFYGFIGLDVIGAIIYWHGWHNGCIKCKKFWAIKLDRKEILNTRHGFKIVTKIIKHKDSDGRVTRTSECDKKVPIMVHTVQPHWRCKYCGYKWVGKSYEVEE